MSTGYRDGDLQETNVGRLKEPWAMATAISLCYSNSLFTLVFSTLANPGLSVTQSAVLSGVIMEEPRSVTQDKSRFHRDVVFRRSGKSVVSVRSGPYLY